MVWVDQPIGVGLSQGVPALKDEVGVATEFMGFWKNFMSNYYNIFFEMIYADYVVQILLIWMAETYTWLANHVSFINNEYLSRS